MKLSCVVILDHYTDNNSVDISANIYERTSQFSQCDVSAFVAPRENPGTKFAIIFIYNGSAYPTGCLSVSGCECLCVHR